MTSPHLSGSEESIRQQCYRCFRPRSHCYCELLPKVRNRTPIVIVQHPRERLHPFGTARMLSLGLERVSVIVDHSGALRTPGALDFRSGTALLYPGPGAQSLETLPESQRPRELVVIDGTWHHARTLYRDIPDLRKLPRVQLNPAAPSRYRIRKEPRAECLSSLEATIESLRLLEPETSDLDQLLGAFDRIIDHQIGSQPKGHILRRRKHLRPPAERPIPRALLEAPERLVVVYGESIPSPSGARALLHWVGYRFGTGETFERLIAPPSGVALDLLLRHLTHMQLRHEDFASATASDEFCRDWLGFLKPNDVVVSYNPSTLELLGASRSKPKRTVILKSAYGNLRRHRGGLDEVVQSERLAPQRLRLSGRAAERLANAIALVGLIRERRERH